MAPEPAEQQLEAQIDEGTACRLSRSGSDL